MRVDLANLVRARDAIAAREELAVAAREAGPTPALTLAAVSLARGLPPSERLAWLEGLASDAEATPAPALITAVAESALALDRPRDAALAWLHLARDARVPLHQRRVAARRATALAARLERPLARLALRTAGELASGRGRRDLLRRALALPIEAAGPALDGAAAGAGASRVGDLETVLAAAFDWLADGGPVNLAEEALARLRAVGYVSPDLERLAAALTLRRPPRAAPAPGTVRPKTVRRGAMPRPDPGRLFESAVEEARAGRAARARRLAEEAIRLSPSGSALALKVNAVDTTLREGGFLKDGLKLCRTYLEAVRDEAVRNDALLALAAEAEGAGLRTLAASWRLDAGVRHAPAADPPALPNTPAGHYLAAQRLLAHARSAAAGFTAAGSTPVGIGEPPAFGSTPGEVGPAEILAHLEKAVSGHAGADAALALAEKLSAEVARREAALGTRGVNKGTTAVVDTGAAARRLELLRGAHAAEADPSRRARLGWRLAAELESSGDPMGAVAVLEAALAESAPGDAARIRGERARLLRGLGRTRELAAALGQDAGALLGDARLPVLAEQATLLEAAGEAERALDVRLMALAEFPGAPAVLDQARRRLEATGRGSESLALAVAALDHTTDRDRRLQLLRDMARLGESAGVEANPTEAATAWLAVLELDPTDVEAATAAERLLVATGDWERCADLLSWRIARAAADPAAADRPESPAMLWRLAELRRAHLDQADEALRLYKQLESRGLALGPLPDTPELAPLIRRDPALTTDTARALVAPTAPDRSRALVGRALALAERGLRTHAERDAFVALDLDPRNASALGVLERLYEGTARAKSLGDELGRRAARLPPAEAASLLLGRGRAAERAGDRTAAREAYRRAMSLDPTFAEPVAALGALAAREGDWSEVAVLLENEVKLPGSAKRRGPLLLELAVVYGDRLAAPERAVSLLETAAALLPDDPKLLDLTARFNLQAGNWQAAADALDRLAARGATIADAADRYFAVGAAAEAAGQIDRALTLYSRSYGRDSGYRPTLERLSALCFERGQWDNAWKATEALLERHGATWPDPTAPRCWPERCCPTCTSGSASRPSRS